MCCIVACVCLVLLGMRFLILCYLWVFLGRRVFSHWVLFGYKYMCIVVLLCMLFCYALVILGSVGLCVCFSPGPLGLFLVGVCPLFCFGSFV